MEIRKRDYLQINVGLFNSYQVEVIGVLSSEY